jgi:hypothetical protein
MWLEGLGQQKNPVTLSGTGPMTFQLVTEELLFFFLSNLWK